MLTYRKEFATCFKKMGYEGNRPTFIACRTGGLAGPVRYMSARVKNTPVRTPLFMLFHPRHTLNDQPITMLEKQW